MRMVVDSTFLKFSIINRRLETTAQDVNGCCHNICEECIPSTMTIKLRKPTKLGDVSASLLRHDGFWAECVAKTCLYLLSQTFFRPLGMDEEVPLAVDSREASLYLASRPLGMSALV